MPHTTQGLDLIPYFFVRSGRPFETYAKIERDGDHFRIRLNPEVINHLAKREFKTSGALLTGIALLHNYYFIEDPHPPDDFKIISIQDPDGPHRPAWVHYRVRATTTQETSS